MPSDAAPEAICLCINKDMICGSDGVTYDNSCQMSVVSHEEGREIRSHAAEPCPTGKQKKMIIFLGGKP